MDGLIELGLIDCGGEIDLFTCFVIILFHGGPQWITSEGLGPVDDIEPSGDGLVDLVVAFEEFPMLGGCLRDDDSLIGLIEGGAFLKHRVDPLGSTVPSVNCYYSVLMSCFGL